MDRKSKYLVTGAAGFIGACLVDALLKQGKEISIIVKPDTNLWRLNEVLRKIRVFKGNLTDGRFVSKVVKKIRPTVIYHLAAHGGYPFQVNADKIITANILGTCNLLKACSDIDYRVFVNTGSSSEYGFKKRPMKEIDILEPNSYYAVAKSSQTLLCQYVAKSQKRPINTFRLFSVYGYYEEPSRLIPTLIRSCLKGEDLDMVSPATARDFIFIEDVIDAYLKVERLSQLCGEIINIGSGVQSSMKGIVENILDLTKAKVNVKWSAMAPRIWDTKTWVAQTTKSRKLIGWKARTTLKEGLKKTIEWYRKNEQLYNSAERNS